MKWIMPIFLMCFVMMSSVSHGESDEIDQVDAYDWFMNHGAVMLIIDPEDGSIDFANIAAEEFYGYSVDSLRTMNINDFNMLTVEEVQDEMTRAKNESRNYFEFRHMVYSGDIKEVEVYSYPIDIGERTLLFSIIIDVTEVNVRERAHLEREAFSRRILYGAFVGLLIIIALIVFLLMRNIKSGKRLKYLTYHDMLTGLRNRLLIVEDYRYLMDRKQLPMTLMVIDIDHLKFVNDTFGHQEGDYLIVEVGNNLSEVVGEQGLVYRISGDEFVAFVPSCGELCHSKMAEIIRKKSVIISGHKFYASVGSILMRDDSLSYEEAFAQAESLMYQNKTHNKTTSNNRIIDSLVGRVSASISNYDKRIGYIHDISKYIMDKANVDLAVHGTVSRAIGLLEIGLAVVDDDTGSYEFGMEEHWAKTAHTEKGHAILNALGEDKSVCNAVLSHHEHYDGTGYPKGLIGEDIPISARVLYLSCVIADGIIGIQEGRQSYDQFKARIIRDRSCFDPALLVYVTDDWIEEIIKQYSA